MRNLFMLIAMFHLSLIFGACSKDDETPVDDTFTPNSIHWGVNIHSGGNNPQNMANKLTDRNLKYVRMDLWGNDPVSLAKFRNAVQEMNKQNIEATAIVYTEFSRDQMRWNDTDADLTEVEQTAYNKTKSQIINTKDLITDYEMQNEVPLYPGIMVSGATGQNANDFDTPEGRLQAAVLRGMSKAIDDVRKEHNLPIRIILGTVSRYFGFLEFMRDKGVLFDVVGYHIYPLYEHKPLNSDPWFGEGGPLGQLAKFNKPVTINEFNAAEIYQGTSGHPGTNYENQAGQPVTEKGFRSLYKHLLEIVYQTEVNVESVYFYEATDNLEKSPPENRFGLYYDDLLTQPKISLMIAAAFAGGALSQSEKSELVQRGFIYESAPKTSFFSKY